MSTGYFAKRPVTWQSSSLQQPLLRHALRILHVHQKTNSKEICAVLSCEDGIVIHLLMKARRNIPMYQDVQSCVCSQIYENNIEKQLFTLPARWLKAADIALNI